MLSRFSSRVVLALCALSVASTLSADVELPPLFSDHMVLQRDRPVPIWGTAKPGEEVTVILHNLSATARTNASGLWRVTLPPMAANATPSNLVVKGKNELTVRDVLVGEVWLCSGQSNMEMQLRRATNGADEVAQANQPLIREFKVTRTLADTPAAVAPGRWRVTQAGVSTEITAVGYFFARDLKALLGVPIGLINSSWAGTPIESWLSEATLRGAPAFAPVLERREKAIHDYPAALEKYTLEKTDWDSAKAAAAASGTRFDRKEPRMPVGPGHPFMPWTVYNGMIYPLSSYAMRGALWYQGESNVDRSAEYPHLFRALIKQWRADRGQGVFPFLFVQLPAYGAYQSERTSWAFFREQQASVLDLPDVHMAVTIDVGEANDIHPRNKQDVGQRLARLAATEVYKQAGDGNRPPRFVRSERTASGLVLHFEHADGLTTRGAALTGFEIAGKDRQFMPASAQVNGSRIEIAAPGVTGPLEVRYAWANAPRVSLYNSAGLPVAPFRTDRWPFDGQSVSTIPVLR